VAAVINDIKRTYRFIDLLKPEKEAAIPVILALEPGRRSALMQIADMYLEARLRRKVQLQEFSTNITALPEQEAAPPVSQTDELQQILMRTVGRTDFPSPSLVQKR